MKKVEDFRYIKWGSKKRHDVSHIVYSPLKRSIKKRNESMNKTIEENEDEETYISVEENEADLENNIDNSSQAMVLDETK